MTAEEKEIKDAERKSMAKIRRVKRKYSKMLASMTEEEMLEFFRKGAEELKAKGYNFS